jgi:hypothetical protein
MLYLERVGFGIESHRVKPGKIPGANAGSGHVATALGLQELL